MFKLDNEIRWVLDNEFGVGSVYDKEPYSVKSPVNRCIEDLWGNSKYNYSILEEMKVIYSGFLVDMSQVNTVSVGTIWPFAGSVRPDGWLFCNGALLIRTYYPALSSLMGSYGNPPQNYFFIPDLRGVFVRGHLENVLGQNPSRPLGTYQEDAIRAHNHQYSIPYSNHHGNNWDREHHCPYPGWDNTTSVGGGETRPVNVAMNFIIKY